MSDSAPRVLIVVNKHRECDPVLAAMIGEVAPPILRDRYWPVLRNWPRKRGNPIAPGTPEPKPVPRATWNLDGRATAELWCISDLLEHFPDRSEWQSSSQRKAERLTTVLGGRSPALVIAVGTAAFPIVSENMNGAVVAGTGVFAHDGKPGNPASAWSWTFDRLVPSTYPHEAFARLTAVATPVLPRLLPVPHNPGTQRTLLADHDLVALGDCNVTNYVDYKTSDAETLKAFNDARTGLPAGSIETTHAVIRATLGDRFMFVSGIADRIGYFDDEVGLPVYATGQNFAAAFNAGVALAWMLPRLGTAL